MFLSQRIPSLSSLQWEEGGFQVSLTLCINSMLRSSRSLTYLWTAWRSRVCLLAPWPPPQQAGTELANSLFVPEPQVGVPDERGCVSLLPAWGLPCPSPPMEYVVRTSVEG